MQMNIKQSIGWVMFSVTGLLMARQNMRAGEPSQLYYQGVGTPCTLLISYLSSTPYLTTGGLGYQMTVQTAKSGSYVKIYSTSNCSASSRVHFNTP